MPRIFYVNKFPDWNNKTSKVRECYLLHVPDFNEPGFYRQVGSLNCFFYGRKKRVKPGEVIHTGNVHLFKNNHSPDGHMFALHAEFEYDDKRSKLWIGETVEKTFESIWEFYQYIGYDYKTRKWSR